MTDWLGSDVHIIPTTMRTTAEETALLVSIIGIAKMAYLWISSPTETNYSCCAFGKHSFNSVVSSWRCPLATTTNHWRREYKRRGEKRVAKFFPQWDGPYTIIKANTESSSYMLNNDNGYPYYASELKPYHANDANLFPGREHPKPGPIMTDDGLMEHEINKIIDSRPWGCGYRYLIWWVGYGPEDDEWLPGHMLEDCEALNKWIENSGDRLDGPASAE